MASNNVSASISFEDLNKGFYDEASSMKSFSISDSSDTENYFLQVTSCESSPEQNRCTTASFNAIRNRVHTFEANSDNYSLIQQPIDESLATSDVQEQESSNASELKTIESSIRVTCKTICAQLVRPIRKTILKTFTKRVSNKTISKAESSAEVCDQRSEVVGMNNRVPIQVYLNGKYQNVALSCDAYRAEPERLDVGQVDIEVPKSNFNQCGDIIYYYV